MIKSLFNDNEIYGVEDINSVFAHLTSGGIVSVSDSVVTAALESGTAQTASDGVEFCNPEACRVIKDSRGYIVSNGSAFMPDGSIVTVSGDGEKVEGIVEGSVNYVFFQRSSEKNGTFAAAATAMPTDTSNILLLAETDASGNITDRRKYAVTKLVPSTGNIYPVRNVSVNTQGNGGYVEEHIFLGRCDVGWSAYRYIRVTMQYENSNHQNETRTEWLDMETGVSRSFGCAPGGRLVSLSCVKNGGLLDIYQEFRESNSSKEILLQIMFV